LALFQIILTPYGASPDVRKQVAYLSFGVSPEVRATSWRLAMVAALSESLPVNATDRTRVLLRLDEATRNDDVSTRLALLAVERAVPIRRFFAWPGKRNYEGFWWSNTVRGHVAFE
jgi:hypothetical protein